MRQRFGTQWLVMIGALLALVMAAPLATAQSGQMSGTPDAHGAMMEGTPGHGGMMMGSTGNGVIYVSITNTGDADDVLIGGETDRAERVEIHEMITEGGVARMQPVDGPLPIPSGETVHLEPGGLHLMLIDLTEDNRAGDVYEITLEFEQAGEVTLQVPVRLDAEPIGDEPESETVEAGDLVLEGVWSRPAPRIEAGMMMGTPEATPGS